MQRKKTGEVIIKFDKKNMSKPGKPTITRAEAEDLMDNIFSLQLPLANYNQNLKDLQAKLDGLKELDRNGVNSDTAIKQVEDQIDNLKREHDVSEKRYNEVSAKAADAIDQLGKDGQFRYGKANTVGADQIWTATKDQDGKVKVTIETLAKK
jgi:predicted RNase H-like nuclease (RuvC/YqgF family)